MKSEISLAPNFVAALLSWYDANRRELPRRHCAGGPHPDPYRVLVSEIMLQQTTVAAVLPYFRRWMERYPTVRELAEADVEEVLRQWEGLGYYSRARNLHATAREIWSRYGGVVPRDPADLKTLPGIGVYTAAAVASMAFGVRAPALDANNLRVWSRLLASPDRRRMARVFSRVLPADRPGDFNQALMDMGTSVCTPRTPDCSACPLPAWCRALRMGLVDRFPEKSVRPGTARVEAAVAIVLRPDGKVLVQRRPEGGLLAGLWEFPGGKIKRAEGTGRRAQIRPIIEPGGAEKKVDPRQRPGSPTPMHTTETPEEAVVREVREETGLKIQGLEKLGVFNHAYTRFRVTLHVFLCKRKAGRVTNPSAKWVAREELEGLAMPSVNRKIVKRLEEHLTAEDSEGNGGNPESKEKG
ncbi:MAG: A/G-specific adenine glycosylase [bacterium]|nr:MAG: A/G-specific adenine glycosylase [bacterium]